MVIKINSFQIFGFDVPFYGVLFVLGFAVAIITAIPKMKKYSLPGTEIVVSAVFAGLGGVLGAKLLSVITSIPLIADYYRVTGSIPWLELLKGGFVFYGGLIGGALGLFAYCKAFKVPFAKYADLYAAGTALGHAFGRVGCIFSGCCYGMPTNGAFYIIYETSIDASTPLNTPLLPTQLIEVIYLVVIYVACEVVFYRTKTPGNSALVYALSYACARFVLEFFRGDEVRGLLGGVSTSQYISVAIFLLCYAVILLRVLRRYGVLKPRGKTRQ